VGDPRGPNGLPSPPETVKRVVSDSSEFLGNDPAEIRLTSHNYARGYLGNNKEGIIILFDSGATSSLISASIIQKSKYLSSLPLFETDPRYFKIGNGEYLIANKAISFQVSIHARVRSFKYMLV
jgi:hypothetical protein